VGTARPASLSTARSSGRTAAPPSAATSSASWVTSRSYASGKRLEELRADGGAVVNAWLMKFQADILDVAVVVPEVSETTALGAAYLAGVATGLWSEEDTRAMWREAARYEPTMSGDERDELLAGWHRAVSRSRGWAAGE
jgi:glycerol kinase